MFHNKTKLFAVSFATYKRAVNDLTGRFFTAFKKISGHIRFSYLLAFVLVVSYMSLLASYTPSAATTSWTRGTISASGKYSIRNELKKGESLNHRRMIAYEKACTVAFEMIASQIHTIRIDNGHLLSDILTESDFTKRQLSHLLQNGIRKTETPVDFYTSACNASISMRELIKTLPFDYPQNDFPVYDESVRPTRYTSVVVDVRGLGFSPMVLPRILDEEGLEIYSKDLIDVRQSAPSGIVYYVHSEEEARKHSKSGEHPFFCPALRLLEGNPVIAWQDARRIFAAKENHRYLRMCRVFFIIDKEE